MTKINYVLRDGFLCLLLSVFGIGLLSLFIFNLSIFNPFTSAFKDFSFLDIAYAEKLIDTKPSEDIIVVNIEQKDRFDIAELINHIKDQNPKVIGLDIVFRENKEAFSDSLLNASLQGEHVIVSKAYITDHFVNNGLFIKKDDHAIGYSNLNFDRTNNVIRTFEGIKELDTIEEYSFSTLVAKSFLGKQYDTKLQSKLEKPVYINYTGNSEKFLTLSYLECLEQNTIPSMNNKIVLVGYMGTPHQNKYDIEDKFFTPLNSQIAGKSAPDMFGVLIHANIIQMLINDSFFYEVSSLFTFILALVLSYIAIIIFIILSTKKPASYMLSKKLMQLLITIVLLGFSLGLFKNKIIFKPEIIIAFMVLSVEFIGFYKIITKKLYTTYKWKSYFFY